MIYCIISCYPSCSDWIIFGLGVIVTIFWALFIYFLRPKVAINTPKVFQENNRNIISVPIENLRTLSRASRISIEIAVVNGDTTFHFVTDVNDFAFIPKKKKGQDNVREFKAYEVNGYLINVLHKKYVDVYNILIEPSAELRVRVHTTHSFSGLGKAIEARFKSNIINGEIIGFTKK